MPATVVPLAEVADRDVSRFGGKAVSCARLRGAGFPVPDGVAIAASGTGTHEAIREAERALRRFPAGTRFAVRSSAPDEDAAGHSFAGVHETTLDVGFDGLPDAIRTCWASAASPRAVAYRQAHGLSADDLRTGVLVQVMVDAVVSGVAFTVNPITGADELVVNAAPGLGDALVSGLVEPDEFVLRRVDAHVLSARIAPSGAHGAAATSASSAASLDGEQLRELHRVLIRIEELHGQPQDVEWCHDGQRFWIVQSRPVTAVSPRAGAARGADIEWTRANLREVLPDLPSPQALDTIGDLLDRGYRAHFGSLMADESQLGAPTKAICGRLYFNLSQLRHIMGAAGYPPAVALRSIGHAGEIRPEDERPPSRGFRTRLRTLPKLLELAWWNVRIGATVRHDLEWIDTRVREVAAIAPGRLSDRQICDELGSAVTIGVQHLRTILTLGGVSMFEVPLREIADRVGFPFQRLLYTHLAAGEKSVSAQQAFDLAALANDARRDERARRYFDDAAPPFHDYRDRLAGTELLARFDVFLGRYGHRGAYESDWSLPRYREDPSALLGVVAAHVRAPAPRGTDDVVAHVRAPASSGTDDVAAQLRAPASTGTGDVAAHVGAPAANTTDHGIIERQQREANEAWQAFRARLTPWQRWTLAPRARWLLRTIKQRYLWRERYRSEMIRLFAEYRAWHLELARRFVERGFIDRADDYFFLTGADVDAAVRDPERAPALRSTVVRRRAEQARWRTIDMPLLLRESEIPALVRGRAAETTDDDATRLHGLCISAGSVEGEVVVLHEPTEVARMKRGAILVAPATDPAWGPLFTLASGLIVEVGGTLSHAATVAREYGLPALANVRDATRRLKTGDRVRLDATNGWVDRVAERPAP